MLTGGPGADPGLLEWFENRQDGIEHGFTLATGPPGRGRLCIEGSIGGLRAEEAAPGDLRFRDG
jgi:hypothetical protein